MKPRIYKMIGKPFWVCFGMPVFDPIGTGATPIEAYKAFIENCNLWGTGTRSGRF